MNAGERRKKKFDCMCMNAAAASAEEVLAGWRRRWRCCCCCWEPGSCGTSGGGGTPRHPLRGAHRGRVARAENCKKKGEKKLAKLSIHTQKNFSRFFFCFVSLKLSQKLLLKPFRHWPDWQPCCSEQTGRRRGRGGGGGRPRRRRPRRRRPHFCRPLRACPTWTGRCCRPPGRTWRPDWSSSTRAAPSWRGWSGQCCQMESHFP